MIYGKYNFRLVINLVQKKVIYRGIELDMMPVRLVVYAFLALLKKNVFSLSRLAIVVPSVFGYGGDIQESEKILDLYNKLAGNRPLEEMSDTGIVNLNADNFTMYKSKTHKDLQTGFELYAPKDLEIASTGKRPNTRFGIGMDKGKIEIVY